MVKQALALAPPPLTPWPWSSRSCSLSFWRLSTPWTYSWASLQRHQPLVTIAVHPSLLPLSPQPPPRRSVQASRPSTLDLMPAAQLSSLMAVDSLSPPPLICPPFHPSHTMCLGLCSDCFWTPPMTLPPPMPQPCLPSSPSLLVASSEMKVKRLKAAACKSLGGSKGSRHPLDPLSPLYNSPLNAYTILVPSLEPGQ